MNGSRLSKLSTVLVGGKTNRLAGRKQTWKIMAAATVISFALSSGQAIAKPDHPANSGNSGRVCAGRGAWIDVRTGKPVARDKMFGNLITKPVVLLGETHDRAEHHRWQLHTLAALHSRTEKLVIGLEMFPRRVQAVLDRWVDGKLTAKAFLKASEWRKVWGFDAELYLPLFNFARMHAIPMIALNIERSLVSSVGKEGWDGVAKEKREGLTDPAPASPSYQRDLARVYLQKEAMRQASKPGASPPHGNTAIDDAKLENTIRKPEFQRFVQAQLTWDRAMAEALATAKRKSPDAVIVGVMGSGHIERFHGVPHQLQDLGIAGSAVLIPVEADEACEKIATDFADAIFTLDSPGGSPTLRERLKLGVLIRDSEGAAVVERVLPGSVAETTKIQKGDRIVRAAGFDITNTGELIEVVSRQAPGTWLPLMIERDGKSIELIAKFSTTPGRKS